MNERTANAGDVSDYFGYIEDLAGTEAVRQIIDQYPARLWDMEGTFTGGNHDAYLVVDHCRWVYPLVPAPELFGTHYEREFNEFARRWAPHPDCTAPRLSLYPPREWLCDCATCTHRHTCDCVCHDPED